MNVMYSGRPVATCTLFSWNFSCWKGSKRAPVLLVPHRLSYIIEIGGCVFFWIWYEISWKENRKTRGLFVDVWLQRCETWKLANLIFMNREMWNVRTWNNTDIRNMFVYLQAHAHILHIYNYSVPIQKHTHIWSYIYIHKSTVLQICFE